MFLAAIGHSVTRLPQILRAPAIVSALLLGLAACTATPEDGSIADPYESVNRASHGINKGADRVFFRPASKAYGAVTPQPVRRSLSNVASNLNEPRSFMNHLAQGDIGDAGHTFFRFVINSTIGVFGLFDPASGDFGLEERDTGFGDTLAVWGAREGAYLELPLFGPSNERDALGRVVDIATNPISVLAGDGPEIAAATSFPSVLNSRYELSDTVDSILYDSADSYSQLRLFYTENRRFELGGQTSAENAFDPYENLYEEVYEGLYEELDF